MQISLQSVSKRYGKVCALDNVTLTLEPGQIVSVLGANGAGKTTLLRCLSGVVVPTSGSITFDSKVFHRSEMDLRRRLAFLPDFPLAFANNTVLRHIGMVLRLFEADAARIEPRVRDLLRGFDLLPLVDTPFVRLSRGQAYKAALTALLAADPELLLLDEPFASGMDPNGITFLKREARAAAARGRTIAYTTQILDIAEKLSDRVCIIHHGEVRHYAPLAEVQSLAAHPEQGSALEQIFQQLRGDGA